MISTHLAITDNLPHMKKVILFILLRVLAWIATQDVNDLTTTIADRQYHTNGVSVGDVYLS